MLAVEDGEVVLFLGHNSQTGRNWLQLPEKKEMCNYGLVSKLTSKTEHYTNTTAHILHIFKYYFRSMWKLLEIINLLILVCHLDSIVDCCKITRMCKLSFLTFHKAAMQRCSKRTSSCIH